MVTLTHSSPWHLIQSVSQLVDSARRERSPSTCAYGRLAARPAAQKGARSFTGNWSQAEKGVRYKVGIGRISFHFQYVLDNPRRLLKQVGNVLQAVDRG
jgi:hypothetical protein